MLDLDKLVKLTVENQANKNQGQTPNKSYIR